MPLEKYANKRLKGMPEEAGAKESLHLFPGYRVQEGSTFAQWLTGQRSLDFDRARIDHTMSKIYLPEPNPQKLAHELGHGDPQEIAKQPTLLSREEFIQLRTDKRNAGNEGGESHGAIGQA